MAQDDAPAVVRADGTPPEKSYRQSEVDHVFKGAADVERQNMVLTNLLVAVLLKLAPGATLELTKDEISKQIDGKKLKAAPADGGVQLSIEAAAPGETRPRLWLPPKVGQ